jgi:uncharacterized protein involved in outer membrane biogenesis
LEASLKKLVYGIFGLLFFVICGVLILPFLIDLNNYKDDISAQAQKYIGREVTVDGDIRLALFPTPGIKVSKIRLANLDHAHHPDMVVLDKLELNVDLMRLLKGVIEVTKVQLEGAKVYLEKLPDGHGNWEFSLNLDGAPESEQVTEEKKPVLVSSPQIQINVIKVANATIEYQQDDQKYSFEDVDVGIKMSEKDNRLNVDGSGLYLKKHFRFEGEVQKTDMPAPFKIAFSALGSSLSAEGKADIASQSAQGTLELKVSPGKVFDSININLPSAVQSFAKDKVEIKGGFSVSPKLVSIDNFTAQLDTLKLEGDAEVDLTKFVTSLRLKKLPGDGHVEVTMNQSKDGWNGTLGMSTNHLEALMKPFIGDLPQDLLKGTVQDPKKFFETFFRKMNLAAQITLKPEIISVQNLLVAFPQTKIEGTISSSYHGNNVMRYDLQISNVLPLLALAGLNLKESPGIVKIKGETNMSLDGLPSALKIHFDNADVGLHGGLTGSKFELTLQHPNATNLLGMFAHKPDYNLGSLKLETTVHKSDHKISLAPLDGSIGLGGTPCRFNGEVSLTEAGAKKVVNANLKTGIIDIGALMGKSKSTVQRVSSRHHGGKESAEKPVSSGGVPWSSEPIDFEGLKATDINVTLKADGIRHEDITLDQTHLEARVFNGNVDLIQLSGKVFGGVLTANGKLNPENSTFKANLKDAQLQRLAANTGQVKVIKGRANLDLDFVSKGKSTLALASNLNGLAKFHAVDGVIQGFDLDSVANLVSNLNGIQLLSGIAKMVEGGETRFANFESTVAFARGIGTFTQLSLKTKGAELSGAGQINLPKYYLDMMVRIGVLARPDYPPLKVRFSGPIDNPERSVDLGELRDYLLKNIFKSLTQGGNPLKNLLDGFVQPQQPTQQTTPQQSQPTQQQPSLEKALEKPQDVIKDVLKGLF